MSHFELIKLFNQALSIKMDDNQLVYFAFPSSFDTGALEAECDMQVFTHSQTIEELFSDGASTCKYMFWNPNVTIYYGFHQFLNKHALLKIANSSNPNYNQLTLNPETGKFYTADELRNHIETFEAAYKALSSSGAYAIDLNSNPHFFLSANLTNSLQSEITIEFSVNPQFQSCSQTRDLIERITIEESDPHRSEKRHILKKVICKTFHKKNKVRIDDFINEVADICVLFDEEFNVYIDKFGLDEFLNKVSEKRIELNSKIAGELTGTTSKFVGVPITLGLTMLVRSNGELDVIKIQALLAIASIFFILISYSFIQALNAHKKDISRAKQAFEYEKRKSKKIDDAILKFNIDLNKLVNKSRHIIIIMLFLTLLSFALWLCLLGLPSNS